MFKTIIIMTFSLRDKTDVGLTIGHNTCMYAMLHFTSQV